VPVVLIKEGKEEQEKKGSEWTLLGDVQTEIRGGQSSQTVQRRSSLSLLRISKGGLAGRRDRGQSHF
jgi:hypothetical protein